MLKSQAIETRIWDASYGVDRCCYFRYKTQSKRLITPCVRQMAVHVCTMTEIMQPFMFSQLPYSRPLMKHGFGTATSTSSRTSHSLCAFIRSLNHTNHPSLGQHLHSGLLLTLSFTINIYVKRAR